MRYKEYREKLIRKRKRIKKAMPFVILTMVFLIALATLSIVFSGSILKVSGSREIEFGDEIKIKANTLFSNNYIEYFDGENWVDTPIDAPGEYKLRVVSKGVLQTKYREYDYTVLPKKVYVTINEKEIEFGNEPTISIPLRDGDYIYSYNIEYESYNKALTKAKATDIVIKNENGDRTKYYEIISEYESIQFTECPIKINLLDASKVYDGVELTSTDFEYEYDLNKYPYLDKIVIKCSGSQLDSGESKNSLDEAYCYDKDGNIIENYRVESNTAKLTVTPCHLTVTTEKEIKTYNELNEIPKYNITSTDYEIKDNLDNVIMTYDLSKTPRKVGEYPNGNVLEITKLVNLSDKRNVTGNYIIDYVYNDLTINPIDIKVSYGSETYDYDGTMHYFENIVLVNSTLLPNHKIVENTTDGIKLAGTLETDEYSVAIKNNDVDVTSCYNISKMNSKITINPVDIEIKLKDKKQEYFNGYLTINDKDYEITSGELFNGDELYISSEDKIIYPGEAPCNMSSYYVLNNEENITSCYNVVATPSTLTIERRKIRITPIEYDFTFDTLEHTLEEANLYKLRTVTQIKIDENGEEVAEKIYIEEDNVDAMAYNNTITYTASKKYVECGTYYVKFDEIVITDELEHNVTEYYDIDSKTAMLLISPIYICVKVKPKEMIYSSNIAITESDIIIDETKMLSGDICKFNGAEKSGLRVGVNSVTLYSNDFTIGYFGEYKDYYSILVEPGEYIINPIKLNVATESKTEEYDASKPLTASGYEIVSGSLDPKHELVVITNGQQKRIGKSNNTVLSYCVVEKGTKADVTACYDIKIIEGVLEYVYKME